MEVLIVNNRINVINVKMYALAMIKITAINAIQELLVKNSLYIIMLL